MKGENEMEAARAIKTKWFWAWQDDKQETWLEEMSRQGLHLQAIKPFGRYVFEQGEPREISYRLDFDKSSGKDSDYFQLIQDAGWERIAAVAGWQYWRKETGEGRTTEIFTDNDSKIRKYQRLILGLSSPAPALFVIVLGMFRRFPGRHPQWFVVLTISIFAVYLLFLAVNLASILLRIRDLRQLRPL
jgi:hypothetical protein